MESRFRGDGVSGLKMKVDLVYWWDRYPSNWNSRIKKIGNLRVIVSESRIKKWRRVKEGMGWRFTNAKKERN